MLHDPATVRVLTFIAACALVLVIVKRFNIDRDPGGYSPAITNNALYPKFYVHLVSAAALVACAVLAGVPFLWAALITLAAGVIYEVVQGYVNYYDIAADVAGVVAVALVVNFL